MNKICSFLSAEFVLKFMPNGGTAVILRTLFVSLLVYFLAIGLKSYTEPNAVLKFNLDQAKREVNSTLHWLGAIVAIVYASLYTRFASQWSYLASLYNQIMSVRCALDQDTIDQNKNLMHWEAAFLEDAFDLHLAAKPMFSLFIKQLLEESDVYFLFCEVTDCERKVKSFRKLTRLTVSIPNEGSESEKSA
ncbi:hypothetical protein ACNKU7_16925 [Microbulbifer sp. SA54]|uniref:hypothetical protein n=1 Tax=Microbulbifer sp. SA54 TaxID=3401577 RepID=UPI003AAF67B7